MITHQLSHWLIIQFQPCIILAKLKAVGGLLMVLVDSDIDPHLQQKPKLGQEDRLGCNEGKLHEFYHCYRGHHWITNLASIYHVDEFWFVGLFYHV